MYGKMKEHLSNKLDEIKEAGLYKEERLIESAQQAAITVKGKEVLNFCANNYLGLSNHPRLIAAAQKMMDHRGYGMSSVRFICGTQDIHKELEAAISDYFKTEDTILYAACFDANGGVFEPLFSEEDAIISDSLNHASIIDGVRLCKAKRYRYANADMAELEKCLQEAQAQRFRIVVTDGVFSMDGNVAPMDQICDLAEKYDALVMVDESHSAGVVGPTGHGVSELFKTYGRVDIYTGTLGKAFGGAMGGFTTGRKEIIDLLRQRSRPYLFSNSVAPAVIGASIEVFNMLRESNALHDKLVENVNYFREKVDERITTLSYEAHVKYTNKNWFIGAKSVLGSNLTQASGLGGFGIKHIDNKTKEQEYTPIRFSSSWLNVVYGQKWKPGIFVGYAKNLGTSDELVSEKLYGTGTNLDKLVTAGAELTYNVPHWKFGVEYTLSSAWYGKLDKSDGKIIDTHSVSNNRIVAVAMFMF